MIGFEKNVPAGAELIRGEMRFLGASTSLMGGNCLCASTRAGHFEKARDAPSQGVNPFLVHIDTDDIETGLGGAKRQRDPNVAEADRGYPGGPVFDVPLAVSFKTPGV